MSNGEALGPVTESAGRVLLVDGDPLKRKLRLTSMTQKGIGVCVAADAAEARLLVREAPYDLVLIDLPRDRRAALKLGSDIKQERPEQRVCFYVDRPHFLAAAPLLEDRSLVATRADSKQRLNALITRTCDHLPGRGRLLEAAWRMCLLRRTKDGSAARPFDDGVAAKDSFGQAVRLAESIGLDA